MFVMGRKQLAAQRVDDAPMRLVERQPRAYRALKLFDLGDDRVESIVVQGTNEKFRLQEAIDDKGATSFSPD